MTKLTDIAKHVTDPAAGDALYIVDVSDTTDGPSGTSGYTTPADLLRNAYGFSTRADAQAATVPAAVDRMRVAGLSFVEDAGGTALTTGDGRTWSPDGAATYEHWGALGNNSADDSDAILACHDWCVQNRVTCEPIGATYRVTKRILDFDLLSDGAGREFHLKGAGKGQTVFRIDDNVAWLFSIRGDTTTPFSGRVVNWSFRDFQVTSNGAFDADVFRIDVATSIEFRDVGVFNCRGTALRLREVWDSRIELAAVECGDDGAGTGPDTGNKYAVVVDNLFGAAEPDLGSNNLDFTPRFHVEASRYIQVYVGPFCKQNMFSGKFHGRLTGTLALPHVLIDGGYRNIFYGTVMTVCADTCIRVQSAASSNAFNNSFIGCHMDSTGGSCIELNDAQRHIVLGNTLINANAGVHLVSGANGNIVHSNSIMNGGVEMQIDAPSAIAPLEYPGDISLSRPGGALVLTDSNGVAHRLTVNINGILMIDGAPV
ncbi:MAG: NosD domain-containing protein [Pseudomonadota bacterium]